MAKTTEIRQIILTLEGDIKAISRLLERMTRFPDEYDNFYDQVFLKERAGKWTWETRLPTDKSKSTSSFGKREAAREDVKKHLQYHKQHLQDIVVSIEHLSNP